MSVFRRKNKKPKKRHDWFYLGLMGVTLILGLIGAIFFNKPVESKNYIIASNFVAYDFTRAIIADTNDEVILLMKPGADIHSYEPTTSDITKIRSAQFMVMNGGENEAWLSSLINESSPDQVVKMLEIDGIKTIKGEEHEWLSPKNAGLIVDAISNRLSNAFPANEQIYRANAENYMRLIEELEIDFTTLVKKAPEEYMILMDSDPWAYFWQDYNFKHKVAIEGCGEHAEPTAKRITELKDTIKRHKLKAIFKDAMTTSTAADTVAKDMNLEVRQIKSLHNVSKNDYDDGKTYVDLMRENYNTIKKYYESFKTSGKS